METWDWSGFLIMLELKLPCLFHWNMEFQNAHAVLDLYPWGLFLFVLGPGSGFGALGLGVGAWAVFLRDIKMI